ncbi:SRPBCC domain-containing protein [Marinoscillum sp. MHG1-6]|uniref:SRPBCC domain-containing protein n=1 Tax=Marinoscillum sp. MHG1-6 TaxID=2959627 RepID=UPI00215770FF|nr:SRPBCC domain-containing protein [Marinoscillum sp. MHG1-6]
MEYFCDMPDFKKYFTIPAAPEEVFAALTFKPTIELWTGSPAVFELKKGAEFSMWDESIVGELVDFDPGKKLVEQWYFGAHDESIVTLKFHPHKKGTSLEVNHTNIPENDFEDIVGGWHEMFIQGLLDFYEE